MKTRKPKQEAFFVDSDLKREVKEALPKIQPKRSEKELIAECVRIALPIIMRADAVRQRFMERAGMSCAFAFKTTMLRNRDFELYASACVC